MPEASSFLEARHELYMNVTKAADDFIKNKSPFSVVEEAFGDYCALYRTVPKSVEYCDDFTKVFDSYASNRSIRPIFFKKEVVECFIDALTNEKYGILVHKPSVWKLMNCVQHISESIH